MSTVLLALGDRVLRDACSAELHAAGHATLVLDRPLAALSLAAKVSWDVVLVDDTSFGRDAVRTVGTDARIVGVGASTSGAGVREALPLPVQRDGLLAAIDRTCPPAPREVLVLDAQTRRVTAGGDEVILTRTEFHLLDVLYGHRPADVSLDGLLAAVWGTTAGVGTAELVRTHIRNLRQKLARLGLPDAIRSHRGRGYALDL